MKRIRLLIFTLLAVMMGVISVNAASVSVKTSATNVTVGKSVTVTVSVSGQDADSWEYDLDYDSSMFTLSSGNNHVLGGVLAGNRDVKFTLKAKKSGTSSVGIRNYSVQNYAAENLNVSPNKVTITARTQAEIEASYSKNNDLKLLDVSNYDISPAFDKNVTDYSLEVENEVTSINIIAKKDDSRASVSGIGEKELQEGTNKFNIVVTAENGSRKTYTLTVIRKELNPIKREIDGKTYTVVRKADNIEAPSYYALGVATIDNEEVPAYKSEITGYTLLAMKDEEGVISFYKYENETLSLYVQLSTEVFTFVVEETTDKVDDYNTEKEVTINDKNVKGYVKKEDSEFILLYGMNASTGEKGWYLYDTKEKTFQRYVVEDTPVVKEEKNNDIYFLLTIVFAGIGALTIILLMIVMSKNTKLRKNNERLVDILENKKEKREQKIEAHFDKLSDRDEEERKKLDRTIHLDTEEEEQKSLEEIEAERDKERKESIKKEVAKMVEEQEQETEAESYDNETEIIEEITGREETPDSKKLREKSERQVKNELLDKVMRESFNNKKEVENKEEQNIETTDSEEVSKRELRRMEKQRRHDEKEEMKKMQEDFLRTDEYSMEEENKENNREDLSNDTDQMDDPMRINKHKKKKKRK